MTPSKVIRFREPRYSIRRNLLNWFLPLIFLFALPNTIVSGEMVFRIHILPEGPGTESRGNTIDEWFGSAGSVIVVGGEVQVEPSQIPSLWLNKDGTWENPILLPHLGFGGYVNDLAADMFPETRYLASGLVYDGIGMAHPVCWEASDPAGPYTLTQLPAPPGGEGEVLNIADLVYLIRLAAGWVADSSGLPAAALWEQDPKGNWSRIDLPPFIPGEESVASGAVVVSPIEAWSAGYGNDAQELRNGITWTYEPGGWRAPIPLPGLGAGMETQVNQFDYDALDRLVAAGWSETIGGNVHGIFWRRENDIWSFSELFPPAGYQNGRALNLNAIIDVLFIGGSADNGPGTETAVCWKSDDSGSTFDTFFLDDRVQGPNPLHLREAVSVITAGWGLGDSLLYITGWGTIAGLSGETGNHAYVLTQQQAIVGGRKSPEYRGGP